MVNQQFMYPYQNQLYVRKETNFPEAMFNHLLFMTKFPSIKVTYLNLKGFSRLLNKTFDSELSFVSRPTMHQSHLRKSATCTLRISSTVGFRLSPQNQRYKLKSQRCQLWITLICRQLAVDEDKCLERHKPHC